MKVGLLAADVAELERWGIFVEAALDRGRRALGRRPAVDIYRPVQAKAGTPEALEELRHLHAEAFATMHLLQFRFAREQEAFAGSRKRYDEVERLLEADRKRAGELRLRLREVRLREAALERALRERGLDPSGIGPRVPPGTALEDTPKPGEVEERRPLLEPLPPRKTLRARLRAALSSDAGDR